MLPCPVPFLGPVALAIIESSQLFDGALGQRLADIEEVECDAAFAGLIGCDAEASRSVIARGWIGFADVQNNGLGSAGDLIGHV